jgi:hypothetical protein
MIGDGMLMILSKEVIGLAIKMQSIICVNRHHKLFCNFNLTECHFQEQKTAKYIKERLEANQETKENVF